MSKTYSFIQGSRGPATRCGGRDGVHVAAQSYDGSVICHNWYTDDNKLMVSIGTNDGSSCYANGPTFYGTIDELNKLLELAHDIKSGKATVVHHRQSRVK